LNFHYIKGQFEKKALLEINRLDELMPKKENPGQKSDRGLIYEIFF